MGGGEYDERINELAELDDRYDFTATYQSIKKKDL
jgi:hypothetical protein